MRRTESNEVQGQASTRSTSSVPAKEVNKGRLIRRTANRSLRSEQLAITLSVGSFALILSITTQGFATVFNLQTLAVTIAVTAVVGYAQAAVLAVGQFNLAVGAVGACSGMLFGWVLQDEHVPLFLGVLLAALLGLLLGWFQGEFIVRTKINAFVVSLGLMSVYMGVMLGITQSNSFSALPGALVRFGYITVGGVPPLLLMALLIGACLMIIMRKTVFARRLLATGANTSAATLSGIQVRRIVVAAHALSGLLAGIAGIMLVAQLGSAVPSSAGTDWLLESFAAPVLGGTLLSGGRMSIAGTLLGACFLSMIDNGLTILGVNTYWYEAFLGGIILLALGIERGRVSLVGRRT